MGSDAAIMWLHDKWLFVLDCGKVSVAVRWFRLAVDWSSAAGRHYVPEAPPLRELVFDVQSVVFNPVEVNVALGRDTRSQSHRFY